MYGQSVRLVGTTQLDTSTCLSLCTNVSRLFVVAQVYVAAKPSWVLKPGGCAVCLYSSFSQDVKQKDVWLKLYASLAVLHRPIGTVQEGACVGGLPFIYMCTSYEGSLRPWRVPNRSPTPNKQVKWIAFRLLTSLQIEWDLH